MKKIAYCFSYCVCVCACRRSQFFGTLVPRCFGIVSVADPWKHTSPQCVTVPNSPVSEMTYTVSSGTLNPSISYRAEFGRSSSDNKVSVGVPKIADTGPLPLYRGHVWPWRNTLQHLCYHREFGHSRSNGWRVINHPGKFDPFHPAFQDSSRSLETVWIDWPPA